MAEMKITVELSAEDRARLDAILAELKQARPNCENCMATVTAAVVANAKPAPETAAELHYVKPEPEHPVADPFPEPAPGTPAAEEPIPFAEPEPKPAQKFYTLEEVRQAVMRVSRMSAEKKDAVKAAVMKYAPKVTQIPSERYPELMTELEKLEALDG